MKDKRKKRVNHGMSKSPEYFAWVSAKNRCHNKNHPRYKDWGERGIEVCEEWRHDFLAFYDYVGDRPSPNHSLDRIDGSKGYQPGNVRWATSKEQSANRPGWVNEITFRGVTMNMTDWAAHVGISRKSLYDRLNAGWSLEDALTLPNTRKNKNAKRSSN